jgi:hypothetical protein
MPFIACLWEISNAKIRYWPSKQVLSHAALDVLNLLGHTLTHYRRGPQSRLP